MKKVLHRSFKPAKCKTALQMAASRLKIMKNKKDTQIKQLQRELAQLLESGQTQTAMIRVEHVVREEKTMTAYELVGIYCELLVARLGLIESQKNCPNDLKEAVASVLYASHRLKDVEELSDIVKHFSAKYGKDFVSAAIGLNQDSGVSRLLVEKLSVKAPDVPTKIKILTEIAKEHRVTWKAESLVESDPKETVVLSGASSSQSAVGITLDSSRIQRNEPPEFKAPGTVNVSQNSYATEGRSSSRTASTDFNTVKTADHYHQDTRPSGDRTDSREHRHPTPVNGNSSQWEPEFVDATNAACEAAKAAERASFAARAAAELSRKERMTQNSTESWNSSSYDNLRNDPPHRSSSSNVQSGGFAKEEMSRSSNRKVDQSTTRAESSNKTVDEVLENASWRRGHSRDNSLEMRPNDSFAKTGGEKKQPSMDDLNLSSSEDVLLKDQSSRASSHSHSQSSNFSDDNDVTPFGSSSILEENRFHSSINDTESHSHGPDVVVAPAFDDYSSFFDKPQFDTEDAHRDEPEQGLGFSLLGSSSKTPDHMPTETSSWRFEEHRSVEQLSSGSTSQDLEKEKSTPPIFDDGPASPPASLHEPDLSAKFDDYDRDSSSDEDNLRNKGNFSGHVEEKPKLKSQKSSMSEVPDDLGRYFFPSDTEDQEDDSMTQNESDAEETSTSMNFEPLAGGLKNEKTFPSYGMSPPRDKISSESVTEHVPTEVDGSRSSSLQTVSSSGTRKDLYTPKASNTDKRPSSIPPDSSSSDDEPEMKPLKRDSVRNQGTRTESRAWTTHLHSHVSHEDSGEEIMTRASTRSQDRRIQKTTPASDSASYLLSVSSDDEDEKEVRRDAAPIQTKLNTSRLSRRTKGQERRSSPVFATDNVSLAQESPPKPRPETKPLAKPKGSASLSSLPRTDKASHVQESLPKLTQEPKPSSTKQEGSASSSISLPKTDKPSHDQEPPPKQGPKAKPAAKQQGSASSYSSFQNNNKVSQYQESLPKLTPEAKSLAKQESSASSSSSLPKTVPSPDPEKTVKEKASHVHPKLPDYDDIFAKLGALRR